MFFNYKKAFLVFKGRLPVPPFHRFDCYGFDLFVHSINFVDLADDRARHVFHLVKPNFGQSPGANRSIVKKILAGVRDS
jgi:hypothetical protein